jgi:citrate lyase alpha subunit
MLAGSTYTLSHFVRRLANCHRLMIRRLRSKIIVRIDTAGLRCGAYLHTMSSNAVLDNIVVNWTFGVASQSLTH